MQALGAGNLIRIGVQTRVDFVGLGLYHREERVRLSTVRRDDVREWGSDLFLDAKLSWRSWFRNVAGLRADGYVLNVASSISRNSRRRTAAIVSP